MELSPLPLMLLLIAGILSGHAEERPKAVVIVDPDKHERTVRCEIPGADDDWTYSWVKEGSTKPFSRDREFSISTGVSHSSSNVTCRGNSPDRSLESEISDAVTLNLSVPTESYKAFLTVQSELSQILREDTVTLTCDVQGENRKYIFRCGDEEHESDEEEFRIRVKSTQTCKCYSWRQSGTSEWSNEVNLTVSDMKVPTEGPKAVLTVHPELPKILREDTVILKCDVQGQNWKYLFKCGDKEHESKEKELKIRLNYTQTCKCLGRTLQNGDSSQWSNEMNLRVFDIINKPIVTIKPQSSVFTGDTVTLSCDVGPFTGQRITWYTNFSTIGAGDDTKTLTDVKISNGGMYKCAVEGGTQGPAVKLTVTERPKALLHVQPDGGIFKGQTVTFTCHIPDSDVTSWSYSWSKNDSVIQDSESQEYKISSVDESHAGLYSCRGRETKGSRNTHTSAQHTLIVSVHTEKPKAVLTVRPEPPKILKGDTVTLTCDIQEKEWKYVFQCGDNEHKSENKELKITVESTQKCKCSGWRRSLGPSEWSNEETLTVSDALADHTRLIAVSAGLGALVLLCFILLLLWCCKRKKDVGSLSPSADHQQHNISQTPEEERKKQTLRSDSVNDSSDVTYAQIEMKANVETKKKNKDDKENSRETPDTVYSKLKI
ncbi:uncharacterized protein si:cabz01036022.1 isoform X2 [Danio rerio]|uniref:Uncharacterized protein si:cabz01036022.1 isoform X2 n=2 Tax=Danio rerio TaxID=7955 RepID=A0AC58G2X4_DANRE